MNRGIEGTTYYNGIHFTETFPLYQQTSKYI